MNVHMLSLRYLLLVTDIEEEKKIAKLFSKMCLPIYQQLYGKGTAKTELLDICGLEGRHRLITLALLPKAAVENVFEELLKVLRIKKRGNGIAVTVPVTGVQERIVALLDEDVSQKIRSSLNEEVKKMKNESVYSIILALVRSGYWEEVIEAAEKAGSKGGTVIRGRRCGSKSTVEFFGRPMYEEQDLVMIIVPKEKKKSIMESIGKSCGPRTEAQGFLISVPVDDALGLEEE